MYKYLIFVFNYERKPGLGGWDEFVGSTDTLSEAQELARQSGDYYQIVDREENNVVERGVIITTTKLAPRYRLEYKLVKVEDKK